MDDAPEPQRHIGHLIRRAQQLHAAIWAREASDRISSLQYGVLAVLDRMPGASQKELGEEISVDRSTVAELVTRMARGGLIGREALETLRPRVGRVQGLLVAELAPADAAELRRLLLLVLRAEP